MIISETGRKMMMMLYYARRVLVQISFLGWVGVRGEGGDRERERE